MSEDKPMTVGDLLDKLQQENPKAIVLQRSGHGLILYFPDFKKIKINIPRNKIAYVSSGKKEAIIL